MTIDQIAQQHKKRSQNPSIIDNRTQMMLERIKTILPETKIAKFAIGYFFISGFESIKNEIKDVEEIRLLIGNITDFKTVEQLAEGYKKLEPVKDEVQKQYHVNISQKKEKMNVVSDNLKETISFMDQTDDSEEYISDLVNIIQEERLKIRIYTKGVFHAKSYLFLLKDQRIIKGYGIVGSSNLSISGISHNTELNLFVSTPEIVDGLDDWFEELWSESEIFDKSLIEILGNSWARNEVSPYDIYIKTLYEMLEVKIEGGDDYLLYWDQKFPDLLEYQEVAFKQAIKILNKYRGVFIADVVGLGKTFIGTALLKYYQMKYHTSALIICPPSIKDMWKYFINRYGLSATILTTGKLSQTVEIEDNTDGERVPKYLGIEVDPNYQYHEFVLIDESHNFRNSNTVRYDVLSPFTRDRKVILLTATPQNNTPWDLYNQIRLFHTTDETEIPIDNPNLKEYFKEITKDIYSSLTNDEKIKLKDQIEKSFQSKRIKLQKLLRHILIRRPRSHIKDYYALEDEQKRKYVTIKRNNELIRAYFPERKLQTLSYSIEATYKGVYEKIYGILGTKSKDENLEVSLCYAFYSLGNYLKTESKARTDSKGRKLYANLGTAGKNLKGLIRTLLFKRFESSVFAFRESVFRMASIHRMFLEGLEKEKILIGKESQKFMSGFLNVLKKSDIFGGEINEFNDKIDDYDKITFDFNDFKIQNLKIDIKEDLEKLEDIYKLVMDITPEQDDKLIQLRKFLDNTEFRNNDRKILIFSQFVDTTNYLNKNLNLFDEKIQREVNSKTKRKQHIIARFSPDSNPEIIEEMRRTGKKLDPIKVLISTDVLSEGLNLQDCYTVINYDLHWNPVRLIQRIGRIDRIGTQAEMIYVYNFLPEKKLEEKLGIYQRLHNRIQEIQDIIGEDTEILDYTENVNPNVMYVIYSGSKEEQEELIDYSKDDELLFGLNEAEELIRKLEREEKEYMDYIKNLPKGIRSGMLNRDNSKKNKYFVSCQAGPYQKFYLVDKESGIQTEDLIECLNYIKCEREELRVQIPRNHNEIVQKTYQTFKKLTNNLKKEIHRKSKTDAVQRYFADKIQTVNPENDEFLAKQTKNLMPMFAIRLPERVIKQLRKLKKNKVENIDLISKLVDIYTKNRISDLLIQTSKSQDLIGSERILTSLYLKSIKEDD